LSIACHGWIMWACKYKIKPYLPHIRANGLRKIFFNPIYFFSMQYDGLWLCYSANFYRYLLFTAYIVITLIIIHKYLWIILYTHNPHDCKLFFIHFFVLCSILLLEFLSRPIIKNAGKFWLVSNFFFFLLLYCYQYLFYRCQILLFRSQKLLFRVIAYRDNVPLL
jgi:hypothetical protein